jgi:hypothetical protein
MRLTWTCFLRDVAVADAATMASSKRTKVFIVAAVAVWFNLVSFAPRFFYSHEPQHIRGLQDTTDCTPDTQKWIRYSQRQRCIIFTRYRRDTVIPPTSPSSRDSHCRLVTDCLLRYLLIITHCHCYYYVTILPSYYFTTEHGR